MNNMVEIQNLIGVDGLIKWIASPAVFSILYSILNIYIFKKVFDVNIKPNKTLYLLLADSLFKAICSIFIVAPYYRIVNMVVTIVLLRLFSRSKYRKVHYK